MHTTHTVMSSVSTSKSCALPTHFESYTKNLFSGLSLKVNLMKIPHELCQ